MKVSQAEIDRRYGVTRQALERDGLDALIVTGTEYTGFEGAIRWLSGFRMVHRYAYAVLPVDGDPIAVFPAEARWVGEHDECWIENKVFAETPGAWMAEIGSTEGWKRVGVYGYNFAMPVRDYRALTAGDVEIVDYDVHLELIRVRIPEAQLSTDQRFVVHPGLLIDARQSQSDILPVEREIRLQPQLRWRSRTHNPYLY